MKLLIAEKKAVADAMAKAILQSPKNQKGYITDGNISITWCSGHLLELAEPECYDPNLKRWSIESLPFYIQNTKHVPVQRTKDQLKVVVDLIKQADEIFHCGDPDDEGQLIVDEILDYVKSAKPTKRIIFNDNNPNIIKKAFQEAKPNQQYRHLGFKALGRSISDWHYGLNLTRAFTVTEQRKGNKGVVSVGRVQDVIKGLVVRRCREIANFTPQDYFVVSSEFKVFDTIVQGAKYVPEENLVLVDNDALDSERRINAEKWASYAVGSIEGNPEFEVIDVTKEEKQQTPPLPYNLLKLQMDMSRKYNISLDRTLEITQELRDQYNAITYNRSDCQYLNDETFAESAEILAQIGENASIFKNISAKADPAIKSKCFNTKIVNEHAHHAIIPTLESFNFDDLTDEQKKCYQLIARSFIAQFYPNYDYEVHTVTLRNSVDDCFTITTRKVKNLGWKSLYKNDVGNEELDEEQVTELGVALKKGDLLQAVNADYEAKQTKPLPYYTEATLAGELTKVAKYIKDPHLKQLMIDKDEGKKGEHGGIGTPATRSTIIKELFTKEFLIFDKKKILATDKAYQLYDKLPDQAKFPDLTAIWHEELKQVKTKEDALNLVAKVMKSVESIIAEVKTDYEAIEVKTFNCPTCDKPLKQIKGKHGLFWSCTGYSDQTCTYSCKDQNGEPLFNPVEEQGQDDGQVYQCPTCDKPLKRVNGQYGAFWSCTGYSDQTCKYTCTDENQKPTFKQREFKKKATPRKRKS